MKRACPTHGTKLFSSKTRYGTRWACPEPDCTVVCWGGETSTPADQETRDLRHACHKAFDQMWQQPGSFGGHSASRKGRAFRWLAGVLEVSGDKCHFGMCNAEQCRKALAAIAAFVPTDEDLKPSTKKPPHRIAKRLNHRATVKGKTREKIVKGLEAAGFGVCAIECDVNGTWIADVAGLGIAKGSNADDMVRQLKGKETVSA